MGSTHTDIRAAALAWAREVVNDPWAVYLDTETTGFGAADVVDIAVVDNAGNVLLDTLVRPTRPIPPEVSRIHGIHDHHVAEAPTWPMALAMLVEVVGARRVVVYNSRFDAGIIAGCCDRHRVALPSVRWECAMLQYAAYRGVPGRFGAPKWHKLGLAAEEFGVPSGTHRALSDAIACRDVVHGMSRVREGEGRIRSWRDLRG